MKRLGIAWNGNVAHVADIFDDTDAGAFGRLGQAEKSPGGIVQFAGWNEFTALVDGGIDSAKVAQTGNVRQAIQDLSNADFGCVCVFDSEIAGGKRALDTVFNGC
jgi:hypothetical protein